MYYGVLVANQRFHGQESLTYASSEKLAVGQLVRVPLQKQIIVGIVQSEAIKPTFATKTIISSWPICLPKASMLLLKWLQTYYPAPLGLTTELFTPPSLPIKLADIPKTKLSVVSTKLPPLNPEQVNALKIINNQPSQSVLLHGDTGTGKTRIYIELAKRCLLNKQSVIVLTPEIGLTGPLLETFTNTFGGKVLVTHSNMTPRQRRDVWLKANTNDEGIIIVGPRSALFCPLNNIGLIVMDEAHDHAYKQEQAPHYQTSRVAAQLARLHSARFVMGSATPLVTDHFAFQQKNLTIIRMIDPAIKSDQKTSTQIIDLRSKQEFSQSRWLANSLLKSIRQALENNEQSLLFLNRRGSARLVLCDKCGWQAVCPHCDVPLTYHQDQHIMRCHSCDFSGKVPTSCPDCGSGGLIFSSIGTKAIETEVNRLFSGAKVSRFDRDTHKSDQLLSQHQDLIAGKVDIIIGTQSIAKGFDLPRLSVVGIISADSGLQIPDYTASERTFQLISQVSGRIGRGHRAGKLFVQTYDPASSLIGLALAKDYQNFYIHELQQRKLYNFPPYTFVLKISCSRASSKSAATACQKLAESLKNLGKGVIVEGPTPRFIEKIAGKYVWHLIIKSVSRNNLIKIIGALPANFSHDLDPSDLL